MMRGQSTSFILALAAGAWASTAVAAPKDWVAPQGGQYESRSNWNRNQWPTARDAVRFDLSSAYTISLTANRANARLLVGQDKVLLDLHGHKYGLTYDKAPSLSLGLARGQMARMTLHNGTLNTVDGVLAAAARTHGTITVSSGGTLNTQRKLNIGAAGSGGLTVIRGGQVNTQQARIAAAPGSSGYAMISGTDSTWNVRRDLLVGARSPAGSAQPAGVGQVLVRPGATLDVDGLLEIAPRSRFALEGGTLTASHIRRSGALAFQSGTINLTEADLQLRPAGALGSRVNLTPDKALHVAHDVYILDQSTLNLHGGIFSARHVRNLGAIDIDSNRPDFQAESLVNDATGRINVASQTARFAGPVYHSGQFFVRDAAVAVFGADVSGDGDFSGPGHLLFQATYSPGDGPANINIENSVAFSPGALLQLDLTTPQQFDQLSVEQAVQLADVQIDVGPNFAPELGQRFTLLTSPQITYGGQIRLPELTNGLALQAIAHEQSLSVFVVPEPGAALLLAASGLVALSRRRRR